MDIGRVGIWTFQFDGHPAALGQEAAAELEELGYGALWLPEAVGREAFSHSALMLSATHRMVVATGIASIYARDPMAMNGGWRTLNEAFPDRFLLGIGVSHQPAVEFLRGGSFRPPLAAMREYLDRMDSAMFMAEQPAEEPQRVLAALGPKMLALAAERSRGAHPYFTTPDHTATARGILGDGPLLAPEQKVVLETDPTKAREIARSAMGVYLGLPNYVNNLKRLGFTDDDVADGGTDRLVDAIVAWGDDDTVRARVQQHHDAGADHVCVQVLPADGRSMPLAEWRRLAPVLLG